MSAPGEARRPDPGGQPRPTLTVFDAVAMIVGIVIGVGIFKAPSIVAGNVASDTVFIALWLAGGLISLVGALCYAELGSSHPHAGGEYYFLSKAYGDWLGFLRYCVPQDRALSEQPWLGRVTRQEIELGIPLEGCRRVAGKVVSRAVRAMVGDAAEPTCFYVASVQFRFNRESRGPAG